MLLVVEDEQSIADFVSLVASDYFDRIDHVSNLSDVENLLHQDNKYRLVLVDLNLDGESGVDVIRLIRDYAPKVPIIVMSGLFEKSFVEANQGEFGLLEKPFQVGELKNLIEKRMIPRTKKSPSKEKEKNLQHSDFIKKLTGKN